MFPRTSSVLSFPPPLLYALPPVTNFFPSGTFPSSGLCISSDFVLPSYSENHSFRVDRTALHLRSGNGHLLLSPTPDLRRFPGLKTLPVAFPTQSDDRYESLVTVLRSPPVSGSVSRPSPVSFGPGPPRSSTPGFLVFGTVTSSSDSVLRSDVTSGRYDSW